MKTTRASDSPHTKEVFVKTGLPALDVAIGGGLPRGRITEFVGAPSSGKTALMLSIIANAQGQGLRCIYIDTEQRANYDRARQLGVDLDKLELVEGDYAESYLDTMEELIREKKVDVIVLDSVDSVVPRAMIEGTNEQQFIGAKARMWAKFLPRIMVDLRKSPTALVFVNQQRMNIMTGFLQNTGGKALEYYKSVSVKLIPALKMKQSDKIIGIKVKGEVVISKIFAPFKKFEASLFFDERGFDADADLVDSALELGVIHREKTTIYFGETKLGVGVNKAREFLKENPDVKAKIQEAL